MRYFSGDYFLISEYISQRLVLKKLNISFFRVDYYEELKNSIISLEDIESLSIMVSENCQKFTEEIYLNLVKIKYLDLSDCSCMTKAFKIFIKLEI